MERDTRVHAPYVGPTPTGHEDPGVVTGQRRTQAASDLFPAWGGDMARAHARTGDAAAMAGYLGGGDVFDRGIAGFAANDAAANERDHAALLDAITSGRVAANRPA